MSIGFMVDMGWTQWNQVKLELVYTWGIVKVISNNINPLIKRVN